MKFTQDLQKNCLTSNLKPKIGLGFMRHDLNKNNQHIVDYAISNGMNYFETCYFYLNHQCEDYAYSLLSKHPRQNYEVCGKLSVSEAYTASETDYKKIYYQQLEKVPGKYFDYFILQTLRPQVFWPLTNSDMIEFFTKEKEKGNIGSFGFSEQCDHQMLKKFLEFDCWDIAQMPLNYYDWFLCDSDKNYNLIKEKGLPIIAQAPLKGGQLINNFLKHPEEILDRSCLQAAMDFVNQKNPAIILTGCSKIETLIELEKSHKNYSPINELMLEKVIEQYKIEHFIPCIQCDQCSQVCPRNIRIPLHFSAFNRALINKDTYFDQVSLLRYFEAEPANECIRCGHCLPMCPVHINIPEHFTDVFNLRP